MGKTPNTVTNTTTNTPNQSALAAYNDVVGKAQNVASTPYTPYSGELTAGLNGGQQQAIGQLQAAYGAANPYLNAGSGYINSASQGLGGVQNYLQAGSQTVAGAQNYANSAAGISNQIDGYLGSGLGSAFDARNYQNAAARLADPNANQAYMNPYQQNVVNATMQQAYQNDAVQQQGLASQAIGSGNFGGDRAGIASAALSGQQALANNQTVAGLNAQNYAQAQQAREADMAGYNNLASSANQTGGLFGSLGQQKLAQAGVYGNLSSAANQSAGLYNSLGQTQAQTAAATGQLAGLSGYLGQAAQSTLDSGAAASLQASTLQQQNQQAQDTAAYNQYQQAQSYPFSTTGWLSNIVQGIGSQQGGTSSTTSPGPSTASQVAGAATTGLGILSSTGAFGNSSGGSGWLSSLFGHADGGRITYAQGGLAGAEYRPAFDDGGQTDPNVPNSPQAFGSTSSLTGPSAGLVGGNVGPLKVAKTNMPSGPADASSTPQAGLGALTADAAAASAPGGGATASPGSPIPTNPNNVNMGLIAAGLGMMSGTSPFAMVNIGQGGLAGLKEYQQLNQNDRANALAQSEIGYRDKTLGLETRKQDFAEKQAQRLYDGMRSMSDALAGPTAPQPGLAPAVSPSPASPPPGLSAASTPSPGAAPGGLAPTPVAAADGPPTPGLSAPPAMASVGSAPQASLGSFWDNVNPQSNPTYLNQQADRATNAAAVALRYGNEQAANAMLQRAQGYRSQAQGIIDKGQAFMNDGSIKPIPGSNETVAAKAGAETLARQNADSQYKFREVIDPSTGNTTLMRESDIPKGAQTGDVVGVGAGSPPGMQSQVPGPNGQLIVKRPESFTEDQKNIINDQKTMGEQYQARQLGLQRLQTMGDLMTKFQTGAWTQDKADILAKMKALGFDYAGSGDNNFAANAEQFLKDATGNVFNDVKGMGGRVLVSEIQGLSKANANTDMQPEANKAIISQGIGIIKYEDQHYKDYMKWRSENPQASSVDVANKFEIPWQEKNPVTNYVQAAGMNITGKGIPVPPAEQRASGQVYMTPKGPARWMGTGWQLGAAN